MAKTFYLFWFIVLFSACKNSAVAPDTYFDSLMAGQIKLLTVAHAGITKTANIDGKSDKTSFVPDSLKWENELAVFRQLRVFNKPSYSKEYIVRDKIKDPNSNLFVRAYTSEKDIPVPLVKFYYHRELTNLKKIEAVFQEKNLLYATSRRLTLEFDDIRGVPVLSSYYIDGVQKMIFSDSVHFSVLSAIDLNQRN